MGGYDRGMNAKLMLALGNGEREQATKIGGTERE